MNIVKPGRKGHLSIPCAILQRLHLEGDQILIVETSPDGAIVLRPATVAPIESYDVERVAVSPRGVGQALVALGRRGACTLVTSA